MNLKGKVLFMLCLIFFFQAAKAESVTEFVVDELNYRVLSKEDLTAGITGSANQEMRTLEVPENVTYNDTTYTVTTICQKAFMNHPKLERLIIRSPHFREIQESAFQKCPSLQSVEMAEGIEYIRRCAFWDCSNLQDVAFPKSLLCIGDGGFADCRQMKRIYLPGRTWVGFHVFNSEAKELIVTDPHCWISVASMDKFYALMPDHITDTVQVETLYFNSNDISHKKSEKYTKIGYPTTYCFFHFFKLKKAVMGDSVTWLLGPIFGKCVELEDITFSPNLRHIDAAAVEGTAWLKKQPDGVVYAGKVACDYKGEMTDILEIKEGTVGFSRFSYNVYRPDIESKRLEYNKVKKIIIPKSMKDIVPLTFSIYKNLTDVYMKCEEPPVVAPNYYYWYEDRDFEEDCYVHYLYSEPDYWKKKFADLDDKVIFHVPKGCKAAYEAHDVWSNYTIVDDIEDNFQATGIASVKAEKETLPVYDLMGRKVKTPKKGEIYIRGGKKYTVR